MIFAGSAAPGEHGASLVILRMAEITLIEAVSSQQAIIEVERNLGEKFPQALPAFRLLVSRCLRVVPDPRPDDLSPHRGVADLKDLPLLVAAVREKCRWLVTFNVRDFQPGHPDVVVSSPGEFVLRVRDLLAHLTLEEEE
ncbi:MAG: PIN domain-containing protein [Thermoflexales bacterium]|nr:PIN domain-containing protein [Thermoflexales bacterium]